MGHWGFGPFENDLALDWVGDLLAAGEGFVEATLNVGEAIDVDRSDDWIAAAEVVATLRGHQAEGLPLEVKAWCGGRGHPASRLVQRAKFVISGLLNSDEYREMAGELNTPAEFCAVLVDLLARLDKPPRVGTHPKPSKPTQGAVVREGRLLPFNHPSMEEQLGLKGSIETSQGDVIGIPIGSGALALAVAIEVDDMGARLVIMNQCVQPGEVPSDSQLHHGNMLAADDVSTGWVRSGRWPILRRDWPVEPIWQELQNRCRSTHRFQTAKIASLAGPSVFSWLASALYGEQPSNYFPGGPDAVEPYTLVPLNERPATPQLP
ncbi:MAG: DUF4259 domain-containing protein [Planctomycetes bacterium]|nr:DUF4259 domain-containing protein [Planctomycetota bacterium]